MLYTHTHKHTHAMSLYTTLIYKKQKQCHAIKSKAVKQLIVINRIQDKSLCLHNICGCTVCNYFIYI